MNISLAAHAAAGTPGAHAKSGKGSDPLADFMAMLGELGITVGEDGTLATTPQAAPATQDIAAKLLAKLGKKGDAAAPQTKPGDPPPDAFAEGDGTSKDDPVTTLADLLTQIDPAAAKNAEPAKLDIATLIAAVRSLAAGEVKPVAVATQSSDQAGPKAAPVTAATAPSIAALLARSARGTREEPGKPVAPGAVQSAFVRLEALIAGKPAPAAPSKDQPTEVDGATVPSTLPSTSGATTETAANLPVADKKGAARQDLSAEKTSSSADKPAAPARLSELLARLTASVKQGAVQSQPPVIAPAQAARPQVDPQVAALAQAIQQVSQDDKPVQDVQDASTATTTFGIVPAAAPSAHATAAPHADMVQANPAEELAKHHLDLARDTQWLDTLARDIARAAQSDNLLRFQLNPEHLGSLKVELLNGAHGTSVKLTADTEAARAILADAQPRLVAEARAQGLRISEAQVDLSGHGGGQRHMAEAPVMIRTANGTPLAEVEQDRPAASGERYA